MMIDTIDLLREGVNFKRLAKPIHLGKNIIQECKLMVLYHDGNSPNEEELGTYPITDILYTYLRPLIIRRLETTHGKKWGILLPPSHSLYKVDKFDHKRKVIEAIQIWPRYGEILLDTVKYIPYECSQESLFMYGDQTKACTPEYATYITFDLLPDISRPLLYIRYKRYSGSLIVLNLIFISRPSRELDGIPIVYSYDGKFIWIGATTEDLYNNGFEEPPINYVIRVKDHSGRTKLNIVPYPKKNYKYNYDDLIKNTSITRVLSSYAIVKTFVDTSEALPDSIVQLKDVGLYIWRIHRVNFKKVLQGSRLRFKTSMITTAPIYINAEFPSDTQTSDTKVLSNGIGVKIVNSEGLAILFEKEYFRKIIEGLILSDIELLKTLLLKYILLYCCYDPHEEYYDFSEMASIILSIVSNRDYMVPDNVKRYLQILLMDKVDDIVSALKRDQNGYDEFMEYVVKVALYSLAHVLAKILTFHVLNTKLENFTLYIDTNYKAKVDDQERDFYAILILENSYEGLGFVEELHKLLAPDIHNVVNYIIDPALKMLITTSDKYEKDSCLIDYERYREAEQGVVDAMCKNNPDLEKFRTIVRELVKKWREKTGISFPSDLLRFILQQYLRTIDPPLYKKLNTDAFLRNVITYVYNTEVPFCWDGCLRCIRLDKSYLLTPIDQIFYLSKKLVIHVLKILKEFFSHTKTVIPKAGAGIGREVLSLFNYAEREIRIISPWISPEIVEFLIKIVQNKNVVIRILTRPPIKSEPQPHIAAIQLLERIAKQLNNIKIVYNDKIHAKVIIIDDKLMITGSMNLTKHGTELNIENITIHDNKAAIYFNIAEFESLWQNSLIRTQ